MNFKKDFPILSSGIIYFDNAATTLKPISVVNEVSDYYINYPANAHRGDYKISQIVDEKIDEVRQKTAKFINADKKEEIIFTSGATESLNMIVIGFFEDYLKDGDEILTTKAEHASLLLPWFNLANKKKLSIKYANLKEDYTLTLDDIRKSITEKTKVISLAHVTNVIADIRPIKEIIEYAHKKDILVVIDAAQSVPHQKVDVKDLDVDFLAFSAHKMLGPTGVGVLYGKEKYLEMLKPVYLGGGMNASFDSLKNMEYKALPSKLEAGTQNIAGIIGFGKAIDYIIDLGIENIHKYEIDLKKYLVKKLKNNENIIMYNENIENGILTFNVKNVFAQDVATYLDKKNICIRVGNHCAKILSETLGVKNTCRISLYFYNTREDVDILVDALNNKNILKDSI